MSQETQILQHLKEHGSITSLQAFKMGCLRLASRVYDLRSKGHDIQTQRWKTRSGKIVARYWLKKKAPKGA